MKRVRSLIMFLLVGNLAYSQSSQGIKFDNQMSWTQVKEKAKAEKKLIFIDGYTTWCIPCKIMDKEVFPDKELGDFFNKNFINIKLQFDKTEKDSPIVKAWYKQAEVFNNEYKINSYPTYIFFNEKGTLIHLFKGGSNKHDFLAKSRMAIDPKGQYVTLKEMFHSGKRDTAFLLDLINVAQDLRDIDSSKVFINSYLAINKDWSTERNLRFIALATTKSTDIGFDFLIKNKEKIDSIVGKSTCEELLKTIAYDEIVLPMTRTNGKKTNYGGGMVIYSGDIIKDVDWSLVRTKLNVLYEPYSEEIITNAMPLHYQGLGDWTGFCKSVYEGFVNKTFTLNQLDGYANTLLTFCEDKKYLENALQWSQLSTSQMSKSTPWYLLTQGRLLYKLGEKQPAIDAITKYINAESSSTRQSEARDLIEKMKNNEKL